MNAIPQQTYVVDQEVNPFYGGRSPIMGWQILSLPKRTQFFKKSMPAGICRIGIRQPRFFVTAY
ncbi:MAG TPA: hypothetical protein PLJ85_01750 [Candidatus Cloacimonas sp.]|nr:hypothetical protein [Candidatus Cloacimonas sp.]